MPASTHQRAVKRPRTDSTSENSYAPPPPQRSTPWFEDGNIVLEAELNQFKVFRGILSANSSIFSDMFAVAQLGIEGEVDGCAVVHLPDTAEDLRLILEALHDSRSWPWIKQPSGAENLMPFSVAKAFLCLGRKYEIAHLREQAIQRLAIEFPTTWHDVDELYFKRPGPGVELSPADIFRMVNVFRENNLLLFLPSALYRCFNTEHTETASLFLKCSDTHHPILCLDDIEACSQAFKKLCRLQASETLSWVNSVCANTQCGATKRAVLRSAYYPVARCSPFDPWIASWEAGLCAACVSTSRDSHNAGRQRVWEQLPSVFGLPDWEELRKSSMV